MNSMTRLQADAVILPERGRLHAQGISIALGEGRQRFTAVSGLDFSIGSGEFVCMLGPSGCGKSTLLAAMAGHLQPSQGQIFLGDTTVSGPGRERGMVFQQHTLFPWKSVLDNVAYGLKVRGVPKKERRERAREFIQLVGLTGFEDRYPAQLSGGMQQRVEIARVLINEPRVLLMDEPFGALDAQTRLMMQELLLAIWSRFRTTVVFVTHDIEEALFLSDRVLVMSHRPGRIREEVHVDLDRPRTAATTTSPEFVALKRRCLQLIREESLRLDPATADAPPAEKKEVEANPAEANGEVAPA